MYVKDSDGKVIPLIMGVDGSTNSLQTIDYAHHEVHSGSHYFIDEVADLSINNVYDMQFTTPDTTKWGHFIFTLSVQSETEWMIYEDAVITNAGIAVPCYNNNRNSVNTCGMVITSHLNTNLAGANADTDVTGATLIRHGKIGSGRGNAATDERGNETILKQNTIYCMRAIAEAAGYINFDLNWYEHTNKN